ncbi:MAG: ABC transporter substrate-binding protein [Defluviitaleaceae bacterium]|nr:ABC transporter substrate-binding protein [Defluviitaleaceae bacterium]
MKNINAIISITLGLMLLFLLTACGSNDNISVSDDASTTAVHELVIGIPGTMSTLDVAQEAGIVNYYIATLVNEGLVAISNDGRPIPALASSWATDDYTAWLFNIREDARFSDGSYVTIEDIVWSIERAMNPELSPGVAIHFLDMIRSINIVDDNTLQIILNDANPNFIWAVSNVAGLFVTQRAWGEAATSIGSPGDMLFGSGPYRVISFNPGSNVTLEAQDYYWGQSADVQRVRFDFITDDAARFLAFAGGSIDFALNIPVEQAQQWRGVDGTTVHFFSDRSYYGLTIDSTVQPFDNHHVRKAVAYALNAQGIIDSILDGNGQVATAITPPEQFASVMDVSTARSLLSQVTHYSFNMDRAREEFALSGVAPFEAAISFPSNFPNVGRASLVLADALSELGITLNVREMPLEQWLGEIGSGEYGISWMIYFATTANPAEIASWLLDGTGPGYNPANFTNEEIAGLMRGVLSVSAEEGIEDLIRAHDIAGELAYYIPVWWGESAVAWSGAINVSNFNSFTMLSENWLRNFRFNN